MRYKWTPSRGTGQIAFRWSSNGNCSQARKNRCRRRLTRGCRARTLTGFQISPLSPIRVRSTKQRTHTQQMRKVMPVRQAPPSTWRRLQGRLPIINRPIPLIEEKAYSDASLTPLANMPAFWLAPRSRVLKSKTRKLKLKMRFNQANMKAAAAVLRVRKKKCNNERRVCATLKISWKEPGICSSASCCSTPASWSPTDLPSISLMTTPWSASLSTCWSTLCS